MEKRAAKTRRNATSERRDVMRRSITRALKNAALPRKHPNTTHTKTFLYAHPVFAQTLLMPSSIFGAPATAKPSLASLVTCDPAHTSAITSPATRKAAAAPRFAGITRKYQAVVNASV
jgi:hypothetical protein